MNVGEGEMGCYWMEPTGLAKVGLRRYTSHSEHPCPAEDQTAKYPQGHEASLLIDVTFEVEWERREEGYVVQRGVPDELVPPHSSRQWPRCCEKCGGAFPRGSTWQAFVAEGYVRSDTGETVYTRHVMGKDWAGALYDAKWLDGYDPYDCRDAGDGIHLVAICPNGGMWVVDGKATGGGYWTRSGDPRRPETLSASPSIVCGPPGDPYTYHGYLQNGRFTPHVG